MGIVGVHQGGDLGENWDVAAVVLFWGQQQEDEVDRLRGRSFKIDALLTNPQAANDPIQIGDGRMGDGRAVPQRGRAFALAVESGLEYDLAFAGGDLFFFDYASTIWVMASHLSLGVRSKRMVCSQENAT